MYGEGGGGGGEDMCFYASNTFKLSFSGGADYGLESSCASDAI